MELPSTASEVAGRPSSRDRSGRTASRLLLLEAAVLALSLPVQVVYLMGQLWESPDAALLDRMTTAIIPLELAALVTGIISGCAGAAIRRGRTDAVALTITAAVLALVQSVGWVLVLRDALLDPTLGSVWALATLLPLLAAALAVPARRSSA